MALVILYIYIHMHFFPIFMDVWVSSVGDMAYMYNLALFAHCYRVYICV